MDQGHVIIDIGPNILTLGLAIVSAVGASVAAYFSVTGKRAVDQANGNLARAIVLQADEKKRAEHTSV